MNVLSSFRFDVNGIKGRVRGNEWLLSPVKNELALHEDASQNSGDNALDIDILLLTGPDTQNFLPEDKQNISWDGSHLTARWNVKINSCQEPTRKLLLHGNRFSRFIVSKWIVEPLIKIAAEKKGHVMVHAGAITDGEKAVLIAGEGGAGKTTWVLSWAGEGHPYLGDDFSYIAGDKILPYTTPLRIGARHLIDHPVLKNMGTAAKLETVARTILRQMSLGKVKFYYKPAITKAVPGIKINKGSQLSGAIILKPEQDPSQKNTVQKTDPSEAARIMFEINREEMHGFGAENINEITGCDFWNEHEKKLSASLNGKPCFSVPARFFPGKSTSTSIDALLYWLDRK